jgi:hypothetical protein
MSSLFVFSSRFLLDCHYIIIFVYYIYSIIILSCLYVPVVHVLFTPLFTE